MREGWTYKKLGEVGNVVTGSTPSTKDAANYASPDYCFVKPSDLPSTGIAVIDDSEFHISAKAFESARQLPKGSIVVSCIGIIGKVGILNKDACTNQQINAIIPNGTIMPKCLAYIICYKKSELEQIANAPVVPIINKGEFSKFLISVPPISEQQSIVAELDKINELISLKKAQLSDLDALAQSIFYDMFGDPIENEKGWEVKKLGEICVDKKNIKRASKCFTGSDNIQYIDISSIDNIFNCILGTTSYSFDDAPSRAQQKVEKGDVLVSLVRPNLKNIAIVNIEGDNLVASSGFCVLRVAASSTYFVKALILTPHFTEYLVERVTGANYPAVREDDIKNCKFGLPPLFLQQDFAKRIELIEQQKAQISSAIKDLETLLASRMQYWFD